MVVACCVMFGKPTSAMARNSNLGRYWVCSPFRASLSWVLPLSIVIGFAIEIGQIYLFPLIGDLSDVGIYALGASSGAWMTVFLARGLSTPEPTAAQSVENSIAILILLLLLLLIIIIITIVIVIIIINYMIVFSALLLLSVLSAFVLLCFILLLLL